MNAPDSAHFLVEHDAVMARLADIDPRAYDRTRNHLDGATTWLGPFLTHGVIDTLDVAEAVQERHRVKSCYRLMFELGWREFFHRTWQLEGDDIFGDLHGPQHGVRHDEPPAALLSADTGLQAVDAPLRHLLREGTLHNHARMWVAAIACNLTHTAWGQPARWLHYHLLDGDLASNTLSWQWIAGTASSKRYVANQDNLNKYAGTHQHHTWLDVPYEALDDFTPPSHMNERATPSLPVGTLPGCPIGDVAIQRARPLALRSVWHLDPRWQPDVAEHLVFIDRTWVERWPMSPTRWRLIEHWAERCGATIAHGELSELQAMLEGVEVHRLEYPACTDWPGQVHERRWLYPMPDEAFPSFSRYWKQVKKSVGL